jgi:hypothetical protein
MTSRLARGKDWAIRTWVRVPPTGQQVASRAIRYVGSGLNAMAMSGEVLMMLPVAVIALVLIDAAGGPGYGLLLVAGVWVTVGRPSVRATVWLVGGLYVAAIVLGLGNQVARAGDVLDAWRMATAWFFTALALAIGGGVFVIPPVRLARSHAPRLSAVVGGWVSATMKGALAGAAAGSLLVSLFPASGPLSVDQSGLRVLAPLLTTALGILCAWCRRLWDQDRAIATETVRAIEQ